jgi:hypothetical protein
LVVFVARDQKQQGNQKNKCSLKNSYKGKTNAEIFEGLLLFDATGFDIIDFVQKQQQRFF